jgi:hypothetical protein
MFETMKKIKGNITPIDLLFLSLITFKQRLYDLLIVKEVVKNWLEVILFRFCLKKKFYNEA